MFKPRAEIGHVIFSLGVLSTTHIGLRNCQFEQWQKFVHLQDISPTHLWLDILK